MGHWEMNIPEMFWASVFRVIRDMICPTFDPLVPPARDAHSIVTGKQDISDTYTTNEM